MREQSCVLYCHQRCQGPQGLPVQVTAKGTWQHYVGPGEASHPRGGQESGQLPLHLPGCYVHQPNGPQECSGDLLPHSIRADTSITPFHSIAKGLPSGGTASFSCPSCIGARMVPSSSKDNALLQIPWRAHLWVEPLQRQPQEDPQLQVVRNPALDQSA